MELQLDFPALPDQYFRGQFPGFHQALQKNPQLTR
jgi:hypothetical protein